ncbi:hypothetical protein FA95DRAFT_333367 [Auriscalpium vulgare]|uniref:Uncharacterized protein n=1 Tax=Auriscalpium vulgare TaxID=40419 RepID=A0ACB8RJT3_9AGAM|nr:hypothetical protein FA95DRAFT_333367 [Auriscalpium vulgare]
MGFVDAQRIPSGRLTAWTTNSSSAVLTSAVARCGKSAIRRRRFCCAALGDEEHTDVAPVSPSRVCVMHRGPRLTALHTLSDDIHTDNNVTALPRDVVRLDEYLSVVPGPGVLWCSLVAENFGEQGSLRVHAHTCSCAAPASFHHDNMLYTTRYVFKRSSNVVQKQGVVGLQ